MNDYKIIANNIKAERIRSGLTQEETAKLLNITRKTYYNYEKNVRNITPLNLYKLSCIFNCNINDFYLHLDNTNCGG